MKGRQLNDYDAMTALLGKNMFSNQAQSVFTRFLDQALHPVSWDVVQSLGEQIGLSEPVLQALEELYHRLTAYPHFLEALAFIRMLVIEAFHPSEWIVKTAPSLPEGPILSNELGLMAIFWIAAEALKEHEKRGIAPEHATFNLRHLKGYMDGYARNHEGALGVTMFTWCLYLGALGLIRIHTLNFMHHVYQDPFWAFRHRADQTCIVLAEAGLNIRQDGQIDGTAQRYDFWFQTTALRTKHVYEGHRVNPFGAVEPTRVKLDLDLYEIMLKPGDRVIDYHIPSGTGYTVANVKQSFEAANHFFQIHYPEYRYQAFWCHSWLSSPQLPFLIDRPQSNIIQVAEQGYVLPGGIGPESLYEFVFKTREPDFATLEANTTLKRRVIEHIETGGTINSGIYLYFCVDLDRYGQAPYRNDADRQAFEERAHGGLSKGVKRDART